MASVNTLRSEPEGHVLSRITVKLTGELASSGNFDGLLAEFRLINLFSQRRRLSWHPLANRERP